MNANLSTTYVAETVLSGLIPIEFKSGPTYVKRTIEDAKVNISKFCRLE